MARIHFIVVTFYVKSNLQFLEKSAIILFMRRFGLVHKPLSIKTKRTKQKRRNRSNMFYVRISRVIDLKGEMQKLAFELEQKFLIKPGIHLVEDGKIKGEKGDASYWDYLPLLERLPTYRGEKAWMWRMKGEKKKIVCDLYLENGLLLQKIVEIELHEERTLSTSEGKTLCLCSVNGNYFQVIFN